MVTGSVIGTSGLCEHLLVVTIPIALESLVGIVFSFEPQKLSEPRVTRQHLAARGVFVIRQVIAAAASNRQVNETPKRGRGVCQSLGRVNGVQVEDDAGVRLFGP